MQTAHEYGNKTQLKSNGNEARMAQPRRKTDIMQSPFEYSDGLTIDNRARQFVPYIMNSISKKYFATSMLHDTLCTLNDCLLVIVKTGLGNTLWSSMSTNL
jgi:hypothetical protein